MAAIHGDGQVYSTKIPVTPEEYDSALAGTINAFIRIGAQGVQNNKLVMAKDDNNQRPIVVTSNYVTQFHGLPFQDAQSQGFETVKELQDALVAINNGPIGDSQPITVIRFQVQ